MSDDDELEAWSGGDEAQEVGSVKKKKNRRTRTMMTSTQLKGLYQLWDECSQKTGDPSNVYPSTEEREATALNIGLTSRKVQIWLQNQRQKLRRVEFQQDTNSSSASALLPPPPSLPSTSHLQYHTPLSTSSSDYQPIGDPSFSDQTTDFNPLHSLSPLPPPSLSTPSSHYHSYQPPYPPPQPPSPAKRPQQEDPYSYFSLPSRFGLSLRSKEEDERGGEEERVLDRVEDGERDQEMRYGGWEGRRGRWEEERGGREEEMSRDALFAGVVSSSPAHHSASRARRSTYSIFDYNSQGRPPSSYRPPSPLPLPLPLSPNRFRFPPSSLPQISSTTGSYQDPFPASHGSSRQVEEECIVPHSHSTPISLPSFGQLFSTSTSTSPTHLTTSSFPPNDATSISSYPLGRTYPGRPSISSSSSSSTRGIEGTNAPRGGGRVHTSSSSIYSRPRSPSISSSSSHGAGNPEPSLRSPSSSNAHQGLVSSPFGPKSPTFIPFDRPASSSPPPPTSSHNRPSTSLFGHHRAGSSFSSSPSSHQHARTPTLPDSQQQRFVSLPPLTREGSLSDRSSNSNSKFTRENQLWLASTTGTAGNGNGQGMRGVGEEEGRGGGRREMKGDEELGGRVGRALPAMLDVVGSGGYAGLKKFSVDGGER